MKRYVAWMLLGLLFLKAGMVFASDSTNKPGSKCLNPVKCDLVNITMGASVTYLLASDAELASAIYSLFWLFSIEHINENSTEYDRLWHFSLMPLALYNYTDLAEYDTHKDRNTRSSQFNTSVFLLYSTMELVRKYSKAPNIPRNLFVRPFGGDSLGVQWVQQF